MCRVCPLMKPWWHTSASNYFENHLIKAAKLQPSFDWPNWATSKSRWQLNPIWNTLNTDILTFKPNCLKVIFSTFNSNLSTINIPSYTSFLVYRNNRTRFVCFPPSRKRYQCLSKSLWWVNDFHRILWCSIVTIQVEAKRKSEKSAK